MNWLLVKVSRQNNGSLNKNRSNVWSGSQIKELFLTHLFPSSKEDIFLNYPIEATRLSSFRVRVQDMAGEEMQVTGYTVQVQITIAGVM